MSVQNNRKQAVSLRLKVGDLQRVKRLAARVGISESDVLRYAVKILLSRFAPLCDPAMRGRQLVPMFIDGGVELMQHFALDHERLEEIVNGDAAPEERIDSEDIHMMALLGIQRDYAKLNLRQLRQRSEPPSPHKLDDTLNSSFRRHLYDKYVEPGRSRGGTRKDNPGKPDE